MKPPSQKAVVEAYFSRRASVYHRKSTRFPWSIARHFESKAVFGLLGDLRGQSVLELGVGAGFYTRKLVEQGASHICAIDLSSAMLDNLPPGTIEKIRGDATTVKLTKTFSLILSTGMIEFVDSPIEVLRNAANHSIANAKFVILAPAKGIFGRLYQYFHHSHNLKPHLFDKDWFNDAASKTGWHVETLKQVFPFSIAVHLQRVSNIEDSNYRRPS